MRAIVLMNQRVTRQERLQSLGEEDRKFRQCSERNRASAVKQRRPDRPGDFPFPVISAQRTDSTHSRKINIGLVDFVANQEIVRRTLIFLNSTSALYL